MKLRDFFRRHLNPQRAVAVSRVGTEDPTAAQEAAFRKALADLGLAQWITEPGDTGR